MSIRVSSPDNWSDGAAEASDELSLLFAAYRDACPPCEGSSDFLPGIWRKIESRQSFWFSFERLARGFAAVAVAVCLFLVALNVAATRSSVPMPGGYADALASASSVERTYYAEGVRSAPAPDARQPAIH